MVFLFSIISSITDTPIHSFTYSPINPFTHSLIHSPTHSRIHSSTHSLSVSHALNHIQSVTSPPSNPSVIHLFLQPNLDQTLILPYDCVISAAPPASTTGR